MKINKLESTKGITKTKSGKYEAYVVVRSATGKSKNKLKAYVGRFNTYPEASEARVNFIKGLI